MSEIFQHTVLVLKISLVPLEDSIVWMNKQICIMGRLIRKPTSVERGKKVKEIKPHERKGENKHFIWEL